jgi:hypothetical protein
VIVSSRSARDLFGRDERKFLERLCDTGIETGPRGRHRRKDVAGLTRDRDLAAAIRTGDTLGTEQAAEHLEVCRVDVDALVDAGLFAPVGHATKPVGYSSSASAAVRAAQINQLRDTTDIDWEAVRSTPAGKPSPLRALRPAGKPALASSKRSRPPYPNAGRASA